jgi:uncharacterized protein YbjT (DUF2867 family)
MTSSATAAGRFGKQDFVYVTSGRNLLAAEAPAGIRHHVALSIVGTDRSDNGYFRAKVVQEKLIKTSGIPYTIICSTQFLEFLGGIAASSTDGNITRGRRPKASREDAMRRRRGYCIHRR